MSAASLRTYCKHNKQVVAANRMGLARRIKPTLSHLVDHGLDEVGRVGGVDRQRRSVGIQPDSLGPKWRGRVRRRASMNRNGRSNSCRYPSRRQQCRLGLHWGNVLRRWNGRDCSRTDWKQPCRPNHVLSARVLNEHVPSDHVRR